MIIDNLHVWLNCPFCRFGTHTANISADRRNSAQILAIRLWNARLKNVSNLSLSFLNLIVLLSLSWKLTNMISVLRLGKNHVAEKEQFQFIFRKKYFYYILLHCLPNWTTRSNWLFLWGCTELLDFGLHKIFIFQKRVQLAMNKGNVQT